MYNMYYTELWETISFIFLIGRNFVDILCKKKLKQYNILELSHYKTMCLLNTVDLGCVYVNYKEWIVSIIGNECYPTWPLVSLYLTCVLELMSNFRYDIKKKLKGV